jgi:hypothetical protein
MNKLVTLRDFETTLERVHAEVCLKRRPFWVDMAERILLTYQERAEARRYRVALHFKLCPLCEELSVVDALECHTCTWQGQFNHDPFEIEEQFELLLRKCPKLIDSVPDSTLTRGMSIKVRVRKWLRRMFGKKKLDIRV